MRFRPRAEPHVACGDCERIRPGLVGQPANTLTSLAFAVAAVPVWRWSRRPGRRAWATVAGASAFEGLGSVAYHGPGGRLSKGVHDAGLVALLAAAGGVAATDPGPFRRPRPLPLALGAGAVALHALSRTGRPLCRPDAPLQGHAARRWKAAAALVAAAHPDQAATRTKRPSVHTSTPHEEGSTGSGEKAGHPRPAGPGPGDPAAARSTGGARGCQAWSEHRS
ncbi:MAG: hypothetical protein ACO1PW_06245 [Actinomycetota bacterium]